MEYAPSDVNTIYAAGSTYDGSDYIMSVIYSSDGGANWELSEISSTPGYVYCLAVHPTSPNIVYAGGYQRLTDGNYGKIFKSINGGVSWSDVSAGVFSIYDYVYSMAIDPNNPETIYVGNSSGIYKSVNGGAGWNFLGQDIRNVYDMAIDPNTGTVYALAYWYGFFSSDDGGNNWTDLSEGMPTLELDCMALDYENQFAFVCTRTRGVLRYDISTDVASQANPKNLPERISLLPNYPNPFNPSTTIQYEICGNSKIHVTIGIYNVSGQLVRRLLENEANAGIYTIDWNGVTDDGKQANSGLYFCVLRAGSMSETRKMTLLK